MKKLLFLLAAGAPLALVTPAHAHFLWAQTDAKDNQVRLYFGEGTEGITEGVKPEVLQEAIAWSPSGKHLPLHLQGGAYRASLENGAPVYGAHQSWGVLDRRESGRGQFRLEYYAKAATTLDKAGFSAKLPFEFFAHRDGNDVLITLKRNGKAVPATDVTFTTPDNDKGTKVTTDALGQVHFPIAQPGLYGLRAVVVDAVPGELDGQKYPQTRTWTTLTFHVDSATSAAKLTTTAATIAEPMGNPNADPQAYALLKAAHENRQVMPASFAGFQAELVYTDGDTTKTGSMIYRRVGETKITLDGLSKDDSDWLEDKVMNLIGHRRGGTFAQGDGKNPLTLVQGDNNEFGQLIKLNDGLGSEYRVKDGIVDEVTRTMGGQKFTISVIQTMNADAGKYLANHFSVAYRDERTNQLTKVEGYHDNYAQMDGVWVPTERTVMEVAASVTPRVRSFRFRNIKFLAPVKVAQTTKTP